jgi:hypothetical protein
VLYALVKALMTACLLVAASAGRTMFGAWTFAAKELELRESARMTLATMHLGMMGDSSLDRKAWCLSGAYMPL